MPFYLVIMFTCLPEVVVVITSRLGTFNLQGSWIVAELNQFDQTLLELHGMHTNLDDAVREAQSVVDGIYYLQSALPDEPETP
jgi:hypothetical protein